MLDILNSCSAWLGAGQPFAVATIVSATGSVPRGVGTAMAVNADGEVVGSLSGGCVEGAVYNACREAMESATVRREQFGYSDSDAFAVGLTCGGVLDVLIQPVYPQGHPGQELDLAGLSRLADTAQNIPAAIIRRLDGGRLTGVVVLDPQDFPSTADAGHLEDLIGDSTAAHGAAAQIQAMLSTGQTGVLRLSPNRDVCGDDYISLLVETRLPLPRLLIFGANDFSAALVRTGKLLGYHVTLCDARKAFTSAGRYPGADEVVVAQPHRYLEVESGQGRLDARSVICVLTHDVKFDIPLLELALTLPVQYVGAMGSRRSHAQRVESLQALGVDREQLDRLHSPIGLDLGAVTPEEVAVSIMAEIIAGRNQHRTAQPLSRSTGPIHPGAVHHQEPHLPQSGVSSWI